MSSDGRKPLRLGINYVKTEIEEGGGSTSFQLRVRETSRKRRSKRRVNTSPFTPCDLTFHRLYTRRSLFSQLSERLSTSGEKFRLMNSCQARVRLSLYKRKERESGSNDPSLSRSISTKYKYDYLKVLEENLIMFFKEEI